jgi:polyphosphate kinase 2 (PPK2 family)
VGRHRHDHRGQPAKRHEAHDPDVEEPGVAPLHVHAKRHDRRNQPHVEDVERDVPAAREARRQDQAENEDEEQDVLRALAAEDAAGRAGAGRAAVLLIRISP